MNRPATAAVVFALALAVLLAVMSWTTLRLLRFDAAQQQVRRQAELEENVGLALWRMDSALAGLIAQESVRPVAEYRSAAAVEGYRKTPYVVAHLQVSEDGNLVVPQSADARKEVPSSDLGSEFRDIAAGIKSKKLVESLPPPTMPVPDADVVVADAADDLQPLSQSAQSRAAREFRSRSRYLQNNSFVAQNAMLPEPSNIGASGMGGGVMTPVWLGGRLLLARRVAIGRQAFVQVCWVDWPAIQDWLAEMVRDLLPHARIVAAPAATEEQLTRRLAALPLLLVPGDLPAAVPGQFSPLNWSLVVAWVCVVMVAAAVGILLAGVVSLSERRAAFVSAVTHELRTPLTTFRMYTELLAEGMVTGEAKRRAYLETLRIEAERLGFLVENVLAYARLERGRAIEAGESITVDELINRTQPHLVERCRRSEMNLAVDADEEVRRRGLRTNVGSVEQILLNLVDNACKYAASADDRRVHLSGKFDGRWLRLEVGDHGPGVARRAIRGLFRPFGKSAEQAARTGQGVGLGLAISRRLARQLGGKLLLANNSGGATFVLLLPLHLR